MMSAPGDTVLGALSLALRLEYLESTFYARGLAAGIVPSTDLAVFQQLSLHENAHVTRLQSLITALGATPDAAPTFDFTAKGAFPDPFAAGNYATFKSLAQAFEDLGVRAYKGLLPSLQGNAALFMTAMRIHAVEARHAAEVRRLRGGRGWVTLANTDIAGTAAIYSGEDNLAEGGVANVATIGDVTSTERASEAFDEPLAAAQVTAIITPFLA